MEAIWKSWGELREKTAGKKTILFGRSEDWVHKTIPRLSQAPAYIVDSNPGYAGASFQGLEVRPPTVLSSERKDEIYIVITGGPYESIVPQLISYGYEPGTNFCCTPAYRDFKLLTEIHHYEKTLIVSCADYDDFSRQRFSKAGGGLFRYELGPNAYERIVPGHFRQIIKVDDVIYAIEYVEMKIYVLSSDLKVLDMIALDMPNYCGLDYYKEENALVLANASTDKITLYDASSFKRLRDLPFSEKSGQHHVNDICVVGDSLYVSYFSYSGNWKRGVLDGGISEIILTKSDSTPRVVVSGLWMPHSVECLDGKICYLDSMRGRFYTTTHAIAGEFPGFVRGLDFDGRFYYIGQSEVMYMSQLFGLSNNIMLNAGFYLFEPETKVSRFYSMLDNMNIHDLIVL